MRLLAVALAVAALPACAATGAADPAAAPPAPAGRFPAEDSAAAWARLGGAAPRLPARARVLARTMPGTTAAHLNLDHHHRRRSPLGPGLAAKVRWTVADALRCEHGKQAAEADLRGPGMPPEMAGAFLSDGGAADRDRLLLDFARRLTLEPADLSDAEVAAALEAYGPEDVVAAVHLVAYANFQARLVRGLGIGAEPDGAVPAVEARPPALAELVAIPRAEPPAEAGGDGTLAGDPGWEPRARADLEAALEAQKARASRLPDPDATRLARMPRPVRGRPRRVAWGGVPGPYQPELVASWYRTMEAFDAEADLDEVLQSSIFWVITRTGECFY